MWWLALWIVVWAVATLALVALVNRARLDHRVREETRALLALEISGPPTATPDPLPDPVARYRERAVGEHRPVRTLRLRHGGTFRMSPSAKENRIRGTQIFTADPPGFLWSGRVSMAPGVWVDARDKIVAGEGSMRVLFESTIAIADAAGPELDQGAALRLLAEMPWYPTAFFDARYVTWSAIDDAHARATLRLERVEVSAIFTFDLQSALPTRVDAERFKERGAAKVPWGGTYHDYRKLDGMLVPFEVRVMWHLETGAFTYGHWLLDSIEYDAEDHKPLAAPQLVPSH